MKSSYLNAILFLGVCFQASAQNSIVHPEVETNITLSSTNPNRFNCTDGIVNDMAFPDDFPISAKAKDGNLYVSYTKYQEANGDVKTVKKKHTLHVVCDSKVYTMIVHPIEGQGRTIRLGDPITSQLKKNSKLLREKSEDELIANLVLAAYHNDLPPNFTVSSSNKSMKNVIAGITFDEIRNISLNGVGLSLKEYIVTGEPGSLIPPKLIVEQGKYFSDRLRGVSIKPERLPENGKARLFVLENKL
ncbi:TraK domain-containing protein [Thalassotalea marina]|uniref:TraK N-terminal domain-containing protein n=1 Tax=Thalassotalea marina TaxID=1673741 RepID=A0A919EP42_9GAMM|nr:type-F conjugative transfer system secretin TraK [Thalassotalea marina]GHG07070.1 hypothetical protein GCM10017161_40880 [Thalassotalea marina]